MAFPVTRGKAIGLTSAAVLAASVAFITPKEGLKTVPYRDTGGVLTVCIGETHVEMRAYTVAECKALFAEQLPKYDDGMKVCLTRPLPDSVHVAFLSATYNIGIRAFCGSSMARLANAGDFYGACDALLKWNKDNGQVVDGLTNRRQAERAYCRKDLH